MNRKATTLAKVIFLVLSLYVFGVSGGFAITAQELWRTRNAPIAWLIVGWGIVWVIVLVSLLTPLLRRRT